MKIKNDIKVTCNVCETINTFKADDCEYNFYSYKRSMGAEIEHAWILSFSCSDCNNDIDFELRAFEYPVGFLNFSDNECNGGEISDELEFCIDNEEDV